MTEFLHVGGTFTRRSIIAGIAACALCFCLTGCGAEEISEQAAANTDAKIAFLTADAETDGIDLPYLCDVVPAREATASKLGEYEAVALSDALLGDHTAAGAVADAYRDAGIRVYVYGDTTLSAYKELFDIRSIGESVNIASSHGKMGRKYVSFDDSGEECFTIVQFSEDGGLLADVTNEDESVYRRIICSHFEETASGANGIALRAYYDDENYISMRYTLAQNTDEIDPDNDYYAIITRFELTGDDVRGLYVRQELPCEEDNLWSSIPAGRNGMAPFALSFDEGCDSIWFKDGVYSDSSAKMDIDHEFSAVKDTTVWSITPGGMSSELSDIELGTEWSAGSGAGVIDTVFSGEFMLVQPNGSDTLASTREQTIRIRFD